MIFTVKEIQTALVDYTGRVSDAGWRDATANLHVQSDGRFATILRGRHPTSHKYDDKFSAIFHGDTVSEVFKKTDQLVIQDVRKKELSDWQKSLAKHIDKGREIGVDVKFINPLVETMKALSENILTDQSE